MRYWVKAVLLCGLFFSSLLSFQAAEWDAPKDGRFTEKQLENYIAAQKELMQYIKAASKAIEGSKTGLGALSAIGNMDEKMNAITTRNGFKKAEFEWLAGAATQTMGAAYIDESMTQAKADLVEQKKKNAAEIAAAKAKLATYESARKSGTRVLNQEQRENLVKQAKEQETAALEEAKNHADEAKAAAEEASKSEGDAKATDALAAKPPADIDGDSKADYVKGKKEEATNSRAAAKESRDKEKEARKAETESKSKALPFANQAAHPEIPITPEEKKQVADENDQAITDTKAELETLVQATSILADGDAAIKKQTDELLKTIPQENLTLVKKHFKEMQNAMGMIEKK